MIVLKKYHFHAAHRNLLLASSRKCEDRIELKDKCSNIHGHTYHVEIHLNFSSNVHITMPFADIDARVMPIIENYDHALIIDRNDPLYSNLLQFDPELKFKVMEVPTSAENVSKHLFHEIMNSDLPIVKIVLQETTSSAVVYEGV